MPAHIPVSNLECGMAECVARTSIRIILADADDHSIVAWNNAIDIKCAAAAAVRISKWNRANVQVLIDPRFKWSYRIRWNECDIGRAGFEGTA